MCDYSLHHVMTRRAVVGDKLVTTGFPNTLTRGFASIKEPAVAVCLLPGTEISFEHEAECDGFLPFLRNRKLGANLARFRQVNKDEPSVHHDALEFINGKTVLLTELSKGQLVTVLQLPAVAHAFRDKDDQALTPGRIREIMNGAASG